MANDIRTDGGDLMARAGDFIVGDCEQTHIEHILSSSKGTWRGSPVTGVGVFRALNGPTDAITVARLRQQMQRQLEFDGYSGVSIQMDGLANISINAERV